MITINGNTIPNIPYFCTNLNSFHRDISGSYIRDYPPNTHKSSGTTDSSGNFNLSLYQTDYQVQIGLRSHTYIYYKNLILGDDEQTINFGGEFSYLSGTTWFKDIPND